MIKEKIAKIIEIFEQNNYEAYLVGGAIRSYYLTLPINDYNVITTAPFIEIKEILREEKITKISYQKAYEILYEDISIKIASTNGLSIIDNLKQRDFTMNMLIRHPKTGVTDYFSGLNDIEQRVIKTLGDPIIALKNNPIRVLRAIRFSYSLNFRINKALDNTILSNANLLKNKYSKRLANEFNKIILLDNLGQIFRIYQPVFLVLFPHLKNIKSYNNTLYEHNIRVLEATASNLTLRLAALLHSTLECGIPKEEALKYCEQLLKLFYYKIDITEDILRLISYISYELTLDDNEIIKFIKLFGKNNIKLFFALKRAHILGEDLEYISRIYTIDNIEKRALELIDTKAYFDINDLKVTDIDLINLGINDKKTINSILKKLLYLVKTNQLTNKEEELLNYVSKVVNI